MHAPVLIVTGTLTYRNGTRAGLEMHDPTCAGAVKRRRAPGFRSREGRRSVARLRLLHDTPGGLCILSSDPMDQTTEMWDIRPRSTMAA